MDNGPLTLGLEDGAIDVERLLVEPQDGHVSMDSVLCFNEKMPHNAVGMEEVSRSFGGSNHDFAEEGKHILKGEVLDGMPTEDEGGFFRLQNDFGSIGEDYLLGVEFPDSIASLDYGSSDRLQTSGADKLILPSSFGSESPWKSDLYRTEESGCHSDQLKVGRSELEDVPTLHECDTIAVEKHLESPTSCSLQDIGKFQDISSCSFEDILSDENDENLTTSDEMQCSSKIEKIEDVAFTRKETETSRFWGQDAVATNSDHGNCSDVFPAQKRSRKPTQRYIDEVEDSGSRYNKKRRVGSSTNPKDKYVESKGQKKCRIGPKAVKLPVEEEISVKAIQVPFASLVHKEHPKSDGCDPEPSEDGGSLITKTKDSCANLVNQKKREDTVPMFHQKKRDDYMAASQKKRDDGVIISHLRKRSHRLMVASQRKRDDFIVGVSPKKWDDRVTTVSEKKRDDCFTVARRKKRDFYYPPESPEEVSGRRKHHILWTIAEVRKLIDGVSQYGVGRWSRIKKLFFATSAHRTSVDLKDKWRNLLKASGILERGNQQGKKRNPAWRPLPKSIISRVCELAAAYPYPKGGKPRIPHDNLDSPDKSTDITLNDYRRILRSINGN